MPRINETELLKSVRGNEISNIYYLYGKDVRSVESFTAKLITAILKKGDTAYNLYKFDGKALNLSELWDTVVTMPFFADYKCILINDFNAEEVSADYISELLKLLSDIPPTTVIIFNITGFDVNAGKKFPSPKNKKLIDFAAKNGIVCECLIKGVSELSKAVTEYIEKRNCTISKKNAEEIVNLCLCNSMLMFNEADKLCAYAGNGEITAEMISALVAKQLDSNSFAFAKAVAAFDSRQAMSLLDELFEQKSEPVAIYQLFRLPL
jgi:DNA polymerase-3 subunit delta